MAASQKKGPQDDSTPQISTGRKHLVVHFLIPIDH